jgi:NCAIR mutase (PurE)-related protein
MNRQQLAALLEQVVAGSITPEAAQDRLLQVLRQAPYEDLGFARVDHHRSSRQGFPEVIFGPGKTAAQISAIAARIVAAGHSLLVTRTTRDVADVVRHSVPDAEFHELARVITRRGTDVPPGRGTIVIAAAGTADLPVAEEAAVCAEVMGNTVDRLYDVGVAGLHRLLAEHARLTSASSSPAWKGRCRASSGVSSTCL